jgi:hypothetical protein
MLLCTRVAAIISFLATTTRVHQKNVISLKVVFGLWEMFASHAVKF